jgi:hypothetical protein
VVQGGLVESNRPVTELKGKWLWLGRGAWVGVALFCLVYFLAGWLYTLRQPLPDCLAAGTNCNPIYFSLNDVAVVKDSRLPLETAAYVMLGLNALGNAAFLLAGFLIAWHRSRDWMALLVSGTLLGLGAIGFAPTPEDFLALSPLLGGLADLISQASYLLPFVLLFLFPDGRFVPRWSRFWVLFLAIAWIVVLIIEITAAAEPAGVWSLIPDLINAASVIIGLAAAIYRYRQVANRQQQQQIKWVALGFLGAVTIVLCWGVYAAVFPPEEPTPARTQALFLGYFILLPALMLFPLCVMIAVLRYRLFDIDLIIRRTLVYGLLTVMLALVYLGAVVVLQSVLGTFSGERSQVVIVISTLIVAALFTPLRRRIQQGIDRRFYRQKYDATQTLADFAAAARDKVDLDELTAELVRVVEETMRPELVSVWLKEGGRD